MTRSMCALCVAAAVVLTACSGAGDSSAATLRAKYGQPAAIDNNGETMATPTPQVVEVTRIVEVVTTPQPAAQIGAPCDAAQPMPTIALDDADRAAGVVLRGQWQPCAYQTAAASEVQP